MVYTWHWVYTSLNIFETISFQVIMITLSKNKWVLSLGCTEDLPCSLDCLLSECFLSVVLKEIDYKDLPIDMEDLTAKFYASLVTIDADMLQWAQLHVTEYMVDPLTLTATTTLLVSASIVRFSSFVPDARKADFLLMYANLLYWLTCYWVLPAVSL